MMSFPSLLRHHSKHRHKSAKNNCEKWKETELPKRINRVFLFSVVLLDVTVISNKRILKVLSIKLHWPSNQQPKQQQRLRKMFNEFNKTILSSFYFFLSISVRIFFVVFFSLWLKARNLIFVCNDGFLESTNWSMIEPWI